MAWTCSGRSNDELIDKMVANKLITEPAIAAAFKKIDRKNYVPQGSSAYQDSPQSIGFGATISAPHMHAAALENLLPFIVPASASAAGASVPQRRILDVGCGSGYLTAAIYHLLHTTPPSGEQTTATTGHLVVGIDHLQGLTDMTMANMKKDGLDPRWAGEAADTSAGGVKIVTGDGRQGCSAYAPFDAIHVGAAAPTIPQPLIDQLRAPGRMFIPVGTYEQDIWQVDKDAEGNVTKKKLFGVRYVPLTDKEAQWRD